MKDKYGPVAVVLGASEGLGEAFARELAARGFDLVLVARRQAALDALAADLSTVKVRTLAADLASATWPAELAGVCDGLDVGLGVYNAAWSRIGPFLEQSVEELERAVMVNCRGPLVFARMLGEKLAARGRGGIVLMSSLAGNQGSALVATYAATKAFDTILAEGLWEELGRHNIDVVACVAGAVATPNYARSSPRGGGATDDPKRIVDAALGALGHGPTVVPGARNKLGALVFTRLLTRRAAVRAMARITRKMYSR